MANGTGQAESRERRRHPRGRGADRAEAPARIRGWRAEDRDDWRNAAEHAFGATLASGARAYDRARMLPRLIAIDSRDLDRPGPALDARIRERLERALRAERARGRAGHWTYDLNRHLALAQALAAEASRGRRDAEPGSAQKKRRPVSRTALKTGMTRPVG